MTTATAAPPTAAALRQETLQLERERRVLRAIGEVHAMGGRHDIGKHDGGPLDGIGVEYHGEVRGLPGIATAAEAAVRLVEVDERLAEIEALMPAAEQREQEQAEQRERDAAAKREQQVQTAITACGAAAEVVADLDAELATVRATLNASIAASPFGALISTLRARTAAALAFRTALAGSGNEQHVLDALGDRATAARRAMGGLMGGHSSALPPAEAEPEEYGWFIDGLLSLDTLRASVREFNTQQAQRGR